MKKFFCLSVAAILLAACSTTGGQKQIGGAAIGAGLGGLVGSQIGTGKGKLAATAAGAVLGALVGAETGASLDRADQTYAAGPPSSPPPRFQVPSTGSLGGRQVPYQPIPSARVASPGPVAQGCERLASGAFACQDTDGTWSIFK